MPTSAYGGGYWQIQGVPGTRAPLGSKFFHFRAVFGKTNLENNTNLGVGTSTSGQSWIRHWAGGLPTKGCAYFCLLGGSLSRGRGLCPGGGMPGWRTPGGHYSSQYASYWNAFLLIIRWTRRMDNTETINFFHNISGIDCSHNILQNLKYFQMTCDVDREL